jgi:hypothetical protein
MDNEDATTMESSRFLNINNHNRRDMRMPMDNEDATMESSINHNHNRRDGQEMPMDNEDAESYINLNHNLLDGQLLSTKLQILASAAEISGLLIAAAAAATEPRPDATLRAVQLARLVKKRAELRDKINRLKFPKNAAEPAFSSTPELLLTLPEEIKAQQRAHSQSVSKVRLAQQSEKAEEEEAMAETTELASRVRPSSLSSFGDDVTRTSVQEEIKAQQRANSQRISQLRVAKLSENAEKEEEEAMAETTERPSSRPRPSSLSSSFSTSTSANTEPTTPASSSVIDDIPHAEESSELAAQRAEKPRKVVKAKKCAVNPLMAATAAASIAAASTAASTATSPPRALKNRPLPAPPTPLLANPPTPLSDEPTTTSADVSEVRKGKGRRISKTPDQDQDQAYKTRVCSLGTHAQAQAQAQAQVQQQARQQARQEAQEQEAMVGEQGDEPSITNSNTNRVRFLTTPATSTAGTTPLTLGTNDEEEEEAAKRIGFPSSFSTSAAVGMFSSPSASPRDSRRLSWTLPAKPEAAAEGKL